MNSPRYTVIIPMRQCSEGEPVVLSLRETVPPGGTVEILIAEGAHPARQRNAALEQARGKIMVFLDNDCSLAADYWAQLDAAFARPEVDVVGGPALLRRNASRLEQVFHALLTHPLLVGPVAARYAPRRPFRATTQAEVILCNLAVRRGLFERIGGFSADLYPNEENEWLDRAQEIGAGVFYDPALQVARPQRGTFQEMGAMLLRYGIGRTRQFRVSGWNLTVHQLLPFFLLFGLSAVIQLRLGLVVLALWAVISGLVALTCDSRLRPTQRVVAGLIAPLIPLTYIAGQWLGWFQIFRADAAISTSINVRRITLP